MDTESLYQIIKEKGGRLTKTRKEIIRALLDSDCLLSQKDIASALQSRSVIPNRSTLFRELAFLVKNTIVRKNTITGVDYYEIAHDHHHHLVCLGCHSIDKVDLGAHLEKQEKAISKVKKFEITNHSLEFYGYCKKCK
jgi:Fur family ferric uptake transcriptional regulator